jgi:hypothetical protein
MALVTNPTLGQGCQNAGAENDEEYDVLKKDIKQRLGACLILFRGATYRNSATIRTAC